MSHHGHSGTIDTEGSSVRRNIDTESKTRDYHNIRMAATEVGYYSLAENPSFVSRFASADNRQNFRRLEIHTALAEERDGRIGAFGEAARVSLIGISQHPHTIPIRLIHLNLRKGQGLFAVSRDGLEDSFSIGREITLGGGKDILGRAEMHYKLTELLRAYAIYLTKGEKILKIVGHRLELYFFWITSLH